jgi:hypothetical protein
MADSLDQVDVRGSGEQSLDSGFVLKVEPICGSIRCSL